MLKDKLAYIIWINYLEIDLLEKFNLNLDYTLTRAQDPNNQNNTLYGTSYQKGIDIF